MTEPVPQPPTPKPAPPSTLATVLLTFVATVGLGAILGYGVLKWWNNTPTPVPAAIALDPTYPGHAGRLLEVSATTDGPLVKWLILSGPTADNFDLRVENPKTVYFCTPIAGDYRLEAIAVVGGEAQRAETHLLIDVGPTPIPPGPIPPGPTPGPIPAGQLRLLMSYDEDGYQSLPPAQQDVLNSTVIKKYVGPGKWAVFSNKVQFTDEPAMKIWKDTFKGQKQLGITIFNGQTGAVAYEGVLPKTVDEAMKLIQTYGGQ